MPYDSYTNDSDSQFAAQIDRYKLGPGVAPGTSAFDASEAAMDSMGGSNENVMALMQARASLHQSSMGTRKAISEDLTAQREAEELDEFSQKMRDRVTGDPVKDAVARRDLAMQYGHNKEVRGSLSAFAAADAGVFQGRQFAAQNRQMDYDDANWDVTQDMMNQERGLALRTLAMQDRKLTDFEASSDDQVYGGLQEASGSLMERSKDLSKKISTIGYYLDDAKDYRTARVLGEVTSNFSKSTLLEDVYRTEINAFAPHIEDVNSLIGGDISKAQTPEEYKQMLDMAAQKSLNLPDAQKKKIEIALESHGKLMTAQIMRNTLEGEFNAYMDKAPKTANEWNSDAGKEWKAGLAHLNNQSRVVKGLINAKQEELTKSQSLADRAYETRKRYLEILEKVQDLKIDAENHFLVQMKQELEQDKVPREEQFKILMAAAKGAKTPAQIEKVLDALQANWEKNPASKSNPKSLYKSK